MSPTSTERRVLASELSTRTGQTATLSGWLLNRRALGGVMFLVLRDRSGTAQVVVDDATITSHIKRIRKKFIAIDPTFDAIETVHGAGYRWKP